MTQPETCGMEGGAISLWFRVITCHHEKGTDTTAGDRSGTFGRGIITTIASLNSTGFHIYCVDNSVSW